MIRGYARDFLHHVRLTNAGMWRDDHTSHALRDLSPNDFKEWTEGDGRHAADGERTHVWGFKSAEHAAAFKAWSETCGIDWSIPALEQNARPARPPERQHFQGPTSPFAKGS